MVEGAEERVFLQRGETQGRQIMGIGEDGLDVEYIRADLVPQWAPVEKAPKDGRRLWLAGWQPANGSVAGYWWVDVCMWIVDAWWSERLDMPLEDEPVYWQPLPRPPPPPPRQEA